MNCTRLECKDKSCQRYRFKTIYGLLTAATSDLFAFVLTHLHNKKIIGTVFISLNAMSFSSVDQFLMS